MKHLSNELESFIRGEKKKKKCMIMLLMKLKEKSEI